MERERTWALREIFEASQDIRFPIPVLAIKFGFGYTCWLHVAHCLPSLCIFFIIALHLRCVNVLTVGNIAWFVYVDGGVIMRFFSSFSAVSQARIGRRIREVALLGKV